MLSISVMNVVGRGFEQCICEIRKHPSRCESRGTWNEAQLLLLRESSGDINVWVQGEQTLDCRAESCRHRH